MNSKAIAFISCIALIFSSSYAQNIDPAAIDTIGPIIRQLKNNGQTIYLLGTIHGAHARNPNYTWPHLDRLLTKISPQLLLVEIRPQHFNYNEYLDGPIEMSYLVYLASTRKVVCKGIDWWLDEQIYDIAKVDWDYREDQMVKQILDALSNSDSKVILVAVGAAHLDSFVKRIAKHGYSEVLIPKWDYDVSEYPAIPDTVLQMWKQGVDYLSHLPYASVERIKNKIDFLQKVIEHCGYLFDRNKTHKN